MESITNIRSTSAPLPSIGSSPSEADWGNASRQSTRPKERHYNIGLVGLGHRGYKTHFLNIVGSRSESIIAVCDANEAALAAFSTKHPDVPAYPSLAHLLRHHKPDFVIVSVPHKFHMDCVTLLSKAGVPVLKEKPIAGSSDEYLQLLSMPVKIGVTFQKRFEPRFVQFQKLLPLVGDIASFRATLALSIEDLEATWRAADGVGVTVCKPLSRTSIQ